MKIAGYALISAPVVAAVIATYEMMPFGGFAFIWGTTIGGTACICVGAYLVERK
jgi:hypothetical protein